MNFTQRQRFFFLCSLFSVVVWGVATLFLNIYTNMIWERIIFTFALFAVFFLTLFSFQYITKKNNWVIILLLLLLLSLLLLIWFTELIIIDVMKKGPSGVYIERGDLMLVFTFYILLLIAIFFRNLRIGHKESKPLIRHQIRYIAVGALIFATPALLTNLILPVTGVYYFNNIGVILSFFFGVVILSSIFNNRLYSIKILILKILRSSLIGVLLLILLFLLTYFKDKILEVDRFAFEAFTLDFLMAVVVGLFIHRIVIYIEKSLTKAIHAEAIELGALIKEMDSNTGKILDINTLVDKVVEILEEAFPGTKFYFLEIVDNDNLIVRPLSSEPIEVMSKTLKSVKSTVVIQELDSKAEAWIKLNLERIAIISPITQDIFLVVKSVNDREFYSKTELDVLEEIITKLVDIFTRVQLYEKTVRFNKVLRKKVQEATAQLQKKYEEERDMVGILGHELRTPLTVVRNSVGLLESKVKKMKISGDVDYDYILHKIDTISNSLLREINILETSLSTSQIDNDKIQVNYAPTNINEVIEFCIKEQEQFALKKNLNLSFIKPKYDIPNILSDPVKVQEIVSNLISNGIKYTEAGEVRVTLEIDNDSIKIIIKDTGEGIPRELIGKLGQKFYRINQYLDKSNQIVRPGGTGLGLYVVKNYVNVLGGELKVESEVGKGSSFLVYLPLKEVNDEEYIKRGKGGEKSDTDMYAKLGVKR